MNQKKPAGGWALPGSICQSIDCSLFGLLNREISIRRRRMTGTLAPDNPAKRAPNSEASANAPPRRDSCARNQNRARRRGEPKYYRRRGAL